MAREDFYKCSTSLAIREMQSKIIVGVYLTLLSMAFIRDTYDSKCWGRWWRGNSDTLSGTLQTSEVTLEISLENTQKNNK